MPSPSPFSVSSRCALFGLFISFGTAATSSLLAAAYPSSSPLQAMLKTEHGSVLKKHCQKCHSADKHEGDVRLDDLALEIKTAVDAERWQAVLNVLNSGEMPPKKEPAVDPKLKLELLADLSEALVGARKSLADQGGKIAMRRLSRREYVNTMRELIGVEPDVTYLPEDGSAGAFDTAGSALFMSSDQIEQFIAVARRTLDEYFALQTPAHAVSRAVRIEPETDPRLKGVLQFERWMGAMEAEAALPKHDQDEVAQRIRALITERNKPNTDKNARNGDLRGQYRIWDQRELPPRVTDYGFKDFAEAERSYVMQYRPYLRLLDMPQLESGAYLTVSYYHVKMMLAAKKKARLPSESHEFGPGRYVMRIRCGATADITRDRRFIQVGQTYRESIDHPEHHTVLAAREVLGSLSEPKVIEVPLRVGVKMDPSQLTFWLREKVHENGVPWLVRNGDDKPALWVDWYEIEGPLPEALPELVSEPKAGQPEADQARADIDRLAKRAFRGKPVESSLLDRLVRLFETRRKLGEEYDVAIRRPLSVVLASPSFLYLNERSSDTSTTPIKLSAVELASRLSYFLWSGPPDAELLRLAKEGALQTPQVLDQQVTRMLADPRAMRSVEGLLHQWLSLERLDFFTFEHRLYPYFDISTREAARAEVHETFADLLRHGRPVTELLKSDFAVVNGMLASYYGLSQDITGDEFRRVVLPAGSPRGGLLGMAAVTAMGSNGTNSNPVERGAWVLRKLLHDPPPPAPPNVPQISQNDVLGKKPRERLLKHQSEPQCASCHRKIDPIGFGLENFDAAGKWRDDDTLRPLDPRVPRWRIDPAGAFHNGPAFKDYFELRDIVASQGDRFTRSFTEALIQFALGRSAGFTDDVLITQIVTAAKRKDQATDAFFRALVLSKEFQSK